MNTYNVGYFVGSLAKNSINRKLSRALTRLAPPELQLTEIPFAELPHYSYDYDAAYPPVAESFKAAVSSVDAVLFVTPEYNRSIPGALKNAIDWASRPYARKFRAETLGSDRHVAGQDRNRRGPTAPAQHPGLLQLTADELDRGLYPIRERPNN